MTYALPLIHLDARFSTKVISAKTAKANFTNAVVMGEGENTLIAGVDRACILKKVGNKTELG